MRVLIVEDDENKRGHLASFVVQELPNAAIVEARSYQSGLLALLDGSVGLVLLDIAMPTFDIGVGEDGGRPQPFAGREILRQMERRGIALPVIVVTQFDRFGDPDDELTLPELDQLLRHEHGVLYRGAVYYDASLAGWKGDLAALLKETLSAMRGVDT